MPELTGTYAWLAEDREREQRVVAALNLDMVGQDQARCGSTLLIERAPCFAASFADDLLHAIRGASVDWVRSYSGPGHYSLTRMAEVPYSGGSDHTVWIDPARGVPCPMLIQWPDRYYHSSLDTPDKTDPRSLALAVRCAATYAAFLAHAGAAETEWLAGVLGRASRRRLLAALDGGDVTHAIAHEHLRGERALASLARLGAEHDAIARAQVALAEFAEREAGARRADRHVAIPDPRLAARPRRSIAAPLHYQRHLLPGWRALSRLEREGWLAREREVADAGTLADLAWYACDGARTVGEIARLVWIESGRDEPAFIADFFDFTRRLGLSSDAETGE
jgi:hypothetical protein